MEGNSVLTEPPTSFEPSGAYQEVDVDIEERQETVLERAEILWHHSSRRSNSLHRTQVQEPLTAQIASGPDPELTEHVLRFLSQRLKTQTPSREVQRGKIEKILQEVEQYESPERIELLERALSVYSDIGAESLFPKEAINLKQIAVELRDIHSKDKAEEASYLATEFLNHIEDHPLVSKRSGGTLDETLSFSEAREILREREDDLRETSMEIFEEIDEGTIREMQSAYLKLIWDNIEPE
jgi:hypothetical protein